MIIGALAFASFQNNRPASNTNVTELIIPNYITSIGYDAFRQFTMLRTFEFQKGSRLETIRTGAFKNCSSIVSLEIPNSLRNV